MQLAPAAELDRERRADDHVFEAPAEIPLARNDVATATEAWLPAPLG